MEVINNAVAVAARAKVYLPPEAYLTLRNTTVSQPVSKTLPQSTGAGVNVSPRFRRGRIASTYTTCHINEDSATTIFCQSENSLRDKSGTEDSQLERESKPLDGNTSHLDGGPFADPAIKLAESDCCYCWNYGHPCEIITEGLCRKLQICLKERCQTPFYHGYRRQDNNNGSL